VNKVRRLVAVVVVVVVGVACGGAGCPERAAAVSRRPRLTAPSLFAMPERPVCAGAMTTARDIGAMNDEALVEVSGLASSLQNPGVVWLVADDDAVVFAASTADAGAILAAVRLPTPLVDPEDLAVGPCPDLSGPCVFVADTGDNDRVRADVAVLAFPEPSLPTKPGEAPLTIRLDAVWTMRLAYPGGEAVDVEALAVLPDASAMLLFEKTTADEARIFVVPAPWTVQTPTDSDDDNDRPVTVRDGGVVVIPSGADRAPTGDADDGDDDSDGGGDGDRDNDDGNDARKSGIDATGKGRRITAADVHPSGTRLLLRTTGGIYEYERPPLESLHDGSVSAFGRGGLVGGGFGDLRGLTPRLAVASPDDEPQGEAIGYGEDGQTWFSISEVKKKAAASGVRPVLHRLECRP
jgi:hypothetical protein